MRFPILQIPCLLAALCVAAFAGDVRSFGAKGDGQADDTAAIQRAVNAGGHVVFPSGTYRITRSIVVRLEDTGLIAFSGEGGTARIVMAGAGAALEFTGTLAGSAAPAQIPAPIWERQRAPRVDALEIVGAHPEADGIAANGTMQLTLTHLIVREARHAIRLHGRNRNVLISDVHLYHNRGAGVLYDNVNLHQSNITGSHISYNGGGGVVVRGGDVRNIHIGNCDIEANMAADGPATANVLIDCAGGRIGEVAITGCTIQHTAGGPDSANVRIIGRGTTGVNDSTPTNEGHVTITGNVFADVQVNVHLQGARGVTLTGNTFWMGFARDLVVEDSSKVIVGPNNFDRNPRYEYTRVSARGGILFRDSADCTLSGLQVAGVRHHAAAVALENCTRFNLSGISILDCDGIGLQLAGTRLSRVSGCIIRDDRAPNAAPSLLLKDGADNTITDNSLDRAAQISPGAATSRDNHVFPRRG